MRLSLPLLCLATAASALRADVAPANFDPAVKPQDDFYHYVNGGWLKRTPIPPAYPSWGAFNLIQEHNEQSLHRILEGLKEDLFRTSNSPGARVQAFYASGMNLAAIEAAGTKPIQAELDRIAAIRSPADVQAEIARLQTEGVDVGFGFGAEQDPKNSDRMIGGAAQAGLGLPDRDYYLKTDDKSEALRQQYVEHTARMFGLLGEGLDQAHLEAESVLRLETALAKASKTNVDLRDPVANYHLTALPDLEKLTPGFSWPGYFAGIGMPGGAPKAIDVGQPDFLKEFGRQLATAPLADWKAYLRSHLATSFAPYLAKRIDDENFAFFGTALSGVTVHRERWKRVLSTIDESIGEDLGRLFVADNFPPEAKVRMLAMISNLRAALRARIQALTWMDEPTKLRALEKLDALGVKVGYPDKWIDYGSVKVAADDYCGNVLRARKFASQRDLKKIGHPVDRGEWEMTPPTVNAYYSPAKNEIVFPAGILEPPFFDKNADDASNYGAIGSIIGHEMTHGFDDEGRQYDPKGNLTDWWTPESAANFKERSKAIVAQFNAYVAIDHLHVNGELTQGENIADLGGVKIAYLALQAALAKQPGAEDKKFDGFTPEQRFFISFGANWRENDRPEALRLQVQTDPHSPPQDRCNGPLSNLPEFYRAFNIPEGSPMRRPEAERVEIW